MGKKFWDASASETVSGAHLVVGRGDRGSSRQTGRTVAGEGQAAQEAEPVGARPGPAGAEEGVARTQRPVRQATSCPRLGKTCQRGPQSKLLLSEGLQVGQPLWASLGGLIPGRLSFDLSPEGREMRKQDPGREARC